MICLVTALIVSGMYLLIRVLKVLSLGINYRNLSSGVHLHMFSGEMSIWILCPFFPCHFFLFLRCQHSLRKPAFRPLADFPCNYFLWMRICLSVFLMMVFQLKGINTLTSSIGPLLLLEDTSSTMLKKWWIVLYLWRFTFVFSLKSFMIVTAKFIYKNYLDIVLCMVWDRKSNSPFEQNTKSYSTFLMST